jgi:hypothetical protein
LPASDDTTNLLTLGTNYNDYDIITIGVQLAEYKLILNKMKQCKMMIDSSTINASFKAFNEQFNEKINNKLYGLLKRSYVDCKYFPFMKYMKSIIGLDSINYSSDEVLKELNCIAKKMNIGTDELIISRVNNKKKVFEFVEEKKYIDEFKYKVLKFDTIKIADDLIKNIYSRVKSITFEEISIPFSQYISINKENNQKLETLRTTINSKTDLRELAKKHNLLDDIKIIYRHYENIPREEISDYNLDILDMPIDSVSNVILLNIFNSSSRHYNLNSSIVKILSKEKEEKPFEEIKEKIKNQLLNEKKSRILMQNVEDIKKSGKFKINDKLSPIY